MKENQTNKKREPWRKARPTTSRYEFFDGSVLEVRVFPPPAGFPSTAVTLYNLILAQIQRAGIDKLRVDPDELAD